MNDQTRLLVNYRLDRAKETLESAEILLKENKLLSTSSAGWGTDTFSGYRK